MSRTYDPVVLFFRTVAVTLCVAIVLLCAAYGGWMYLTKDMTEEVYDPNVSVDITDDKNEIKESTTFTEQTFSNLKSNIKAWYNTGQPASEEGVTNILLMGIDVESENMNINSRADAMVIVSINHNTKEITLASIMRDQYSYMMHNGKESYEKLHHANSYGGPSKQIELIERYYKIAIDNYALVNFYSLPKIIDKMGGVKVNITKTEADYMNSDWGASVKAGESRIDGATALLYMRIRHQTGGDSARVNRQQAVIKEIFKELKTLSKSELVSLISSITKYIRTGYSSEQMLSLATEALMNGWFDYTVKQVSLPDDTCSVGDIIGNVWYWKVDFPLAAQKMQYALYGKTNIVLKENRVSWIK